MNKLKFSILLTITIFFLGGCSAITGQTGTPPTAIPLATEAAGVISEGRIVPQQYVQLSFNTGGTVGELLVKEGEAVQSGQVIARLDQREQLASAVAQAQTEQLNASLALKELTDNAEVFSAEALKKVADGREAVREATRRLTNLKTGNSQTDIDSASANMIILQDRYETAQKDYASYENKPETNLKRAELLSKLADAEKKYDNAVRLYNNLQGTASEIDLAVAEANLSLAEAQLALAVDEYEKKKGGPDPDDLAAAQARLKAADTALAAAQSAYADTELKAPFSGTIAQLNLKEGEQVLPGQAAAVLGDFSGWIVETDDLTEIEVPNIQAGEGVRLTFDALPGLELGGVIETVSSIYEEKRGDVTYTVKIRLVETDPRLRWGMTTVANFEEK